jgi:ubiquinone/menaquinone biosynthesis C-methylase UbiE
LSRRLRLPPKGSLPTTGPVDSIDWYYRPLVGIIMRGRLAFVRDLLAVRQPRTVLEIGYGSGIFQYELAPLSQVSVGLDMHEHGAAVRTRLAQDHVAVQLVRGDGCVLPFAAASFDAVVIVSALEFVPDPVACLQESVRVVRKGGCLIFLTPRPLLWADRILQLLVGVKPEAQFQGGRERVQAALRQVTPSASRFGYPRWLPSWLQPYDVIMYEAR